MEKLKKNLKEEIIEDLKEYFGESKAETAFDFYYSMTRPKIEYFSKILWRIRYLKYPHTRGRKLGNKSKAIPDRIWKAVLEHFKLVNDEVALAVEIEGIEGPRINDVLCLKVNDVDFKKHELNVYNHKCKRWYNVPLSLDMETDLNNYIKKHKKEIEAHDNYLFFTKDDKHHPNRRYNHLEQHYINRKLKEYLKESGFDVIYAHREGDNAPLHQYTTHSNRGHAATQIEKKTGDMKLVQKLMDHSPRSLSTTMLYIEDEDDELRNVMRK